MECHQKCKIRAQQEELKSEYPDGDIPFERAKPLWEACIVCSHGCAGTRRTETSPGRKPCKTYISKRQLEANQKKLEDEVAKIKRKAEACPDLYSFVLGKKEAALQEVKKLLAACLRTCSVCSHSADDNPSRSGETFVSIDSNLTGNGKSNNAAEDEDGEHQSTSLGDYILTHRVGADDDEFNFDEPEEKRAAENYTVTATLPPDVEDRLRIMMTDFSCSLSLVDKLLIIILLTRKPHGDLNERYSLEDFAKLNWITYTDKKGRVQETDFARFLRACGWGPLAHREGSGVSKQAVSQRYQRIVAKIPALKAVAHGQIGKPRGDGSGRRARQVSRQKGKRP